VKDLLILPYVKSDTKPLSSKKRKAADFNSTPALTAPSLSITFKTILQKSNRSFYEIKNNSFSNTGM